ncbi:MAG TPA: FliH/SctL family protein [Pirellulales bacterium]|jgi:flagellar biosynthesis/type III secretory pathway protein FliH|nr:FliH/SctL family protein [Pirellulales bacterium]
MSGIIKATDRNRGVHGVAFNFEDMAQGADTYLGKIREQARQTLAQAVEEAKTIRQRAEAEGRQAGERALNELVSQQVARQLDTVMPALKQVIGQIEGSRPGWLAHWEQRAVHLAAAIAGRIVQRQVAADPGITVELVRAGLELARGTSEVRIVLHPEDVASLGDQVERLVAEFSRLGTPVIVGDERIARGGCRIETRHGAVDQQFAAQLDRIEAELT